MSGERLRLSAGLGISLVINAFVLVPGLAADLTGIAADSGDQTHVRPPQFTPEPEAPEVKLGIDESEASTLTWIGYEQFQEHMARLAEMEQAQFDLGGAAVAGGGSPAGADVAPQPRPEAVQPLETTASDAPSDPSTADATVAANPKQPPLPAMPDDTLPAPRDSQEQADETPPLAAATPAKDSPTPAPPEQPPSPPGAAADTANANDAPAAPANDASQSAEDLPPTPDPSDQEADAATKVQVNVKRQGGPVAARGLRVRTIRPKLTPYQESRFGRIAINVKIEFARSGAPKRIYIARPHPKTGKVLWEPGSATVGFESAIISALYRWRASGKQLNELDKDETLPVLFELIYR